MTIKYIQTKDILFMKKSFKKYILLPALALSAVAAATTAIACSNGVSVEPAQVTKDLQANKDFLTTLTFSGNLEEVTGTTDKAALQTWLTANKATVTPTLSADTKATRTAELTTKDVTVTAPTDTTVTLTVVSVAYDGTDSSKLNVLLKATKGDSTVHFVKQITGKAKNPVGSAQFALAVSDPTNPRWKTAEGILQTAATNSGFGGKTTNNGDQIKQNSALETALTSGAKGVLVSAKDSASIGSVVNDASHRKVPLVAYDRLITGSDKYDYYVTYNNERVGTLQGYSLVKAIYSATHSWDASKSVEDNVNALIEEVKGKKLSEDKFIYLSAGDPADNNSKLFFNGAMEVIKKAQTEDAHLKFLNTATAFENVATTDWVAQTAAASFQTVYNTATETQRANLVGILAPNDGLAIGLADALKTVAGTAEKDTIWSKVFITGQDGIEGVVSSLKAKNSKVDMTIKKADEPLSRAGTAILTLLTAYPNATREQVAAFVKLTSPNDNWQLDTTSYKVGSKVITTFSFTPVIVTPENVATEFPS
ncbi:hypothetical protein CJJ23_02765 [Mycoplasmopsis agassizii]|uniref:Periplasmic binding protein domain-containing protein n=1 Tax=Mycoplasmopsis agassizii TaxID=33922 RepID=A0A269TIR3_9BACT|nr:substrate-binding domain-containing protein [Mycoplasmopsis agassizii]PAK21334.1 hypothetical protein CJJ23_02765 [Mycoplasmopsis agassizii]